MATSTRAAQSGQSNGAVPPKRPEKSFRVGHCYATIWANEVRPEGDSGKPTRTMRSVHLERRFWNEKLNDGQGDYDSSASYGLGDIHNALAVLELAAEYLRESEADVTRE